MLYALYEEADETIEKIRNKFNQFLNYGSTVALGEARVLARQVQEKLDKIAKSEEIKREKEKRLWTTN